MTPYELWQLEKYGNFYEEDETQHDVEPDLGEMQTLQIFIHYNTKKTITMSQMQLPKWGDLNTLERHKLLGELIDAMIYSGEAVSHLQRTVEEFRSMGLIKSIILPENDPNES